ncbi:hypothetical protein K2P96_02115, partial [Patescibacteria group bacterium]|nr:hypothetical protein [Patescibacteria group bacterium]
YGRFPDYNTLFGLTGLTETTFRTVFYARKISTVASFDDMLDRLVSGGHKRTDLQIEDVLGLVTDETSIAFSAVLEVQRLREGVAQINSMVRRRFSTMDSEIYLRHYGFHDGSFKREKVESLCERFSVTKREVENIRQKINKYIRENIPNFTLCDFSEERWSALVELSLAFL